MSLPGPLELGLRWIEDSVSVREDSIECDGRQVPILYRRNALARRYRLFVDREGRARVTIPRRGSRREAQRFLEEHRDWLTGQLRRFQNRRAQSSGWRIGGEILFRGVACRLEPAPEQAGECISLGGELIVTRCNSDGRECDLRVAVERHLRRLAGVELPRRVCELAGLHQCTVENVTVRNQRTRWGSCSRRGNISLNWRLIQVPPEVLDYIIVHELMHLREMNHSRRFWALVAKVCPEYKTAEAWLRAHSGLLM
jgi:predicted metal-dependent hydrolase